MRQKKEKKEELRKKNIREKISDALQISHEIVMDVPKITTTSNTEVTIENYRGVIEYETNVIRVNTTAFVVKIIGRGLEIKNITAEDIVIAGVIGNIEFVI